MTEIIRNCFLELVIWLSKQQEHCVGVFFRARSKNFPTNLQQSAKILILCQQDIYGTVVKNIPEM